MIQLLLFGGTTEGRQLAQWAAARGTADMTACTATDYGAQLLEESPHLVPVAGRMDQAAMEKLMRAVPYACVIDATHPYAVDVSQNVAKAAEACGIPVVRVVREGEPEGDWTCMDTVEDAAAYLAGVPGNILLTTGTRDLEAFTRAIPDFKDRMWVRILPVVSSLQHTLDLGVPVSHIVAAQGPFTKYTNMAQIGQYRVKHLVTKASGEAGGFWQKIDACKKLEIEAVVIHRPTHEQGLSVEETQRMLADALGV